MPAGSEKETAPCIFTISVADTGIGMSAQEQARIFKRFSQANNRTSKVCQRDREGDKRDNQRAKQRVRGGCRWNHTNSFLFFHTGIRRVWFGTIYIHCSFSSLLLLPPSSSSFFFFFDSCNICKKLAKLMNGTVSLKSEERKGTTFTVRLQCNRVLESSLSLSYSTEVSSFNLPPGTLSLTESVDLPQLPQPPQPPQLPSAKGEEGEAKGKVETPKPQRILVAEDNLMNQTLLSKVLSLKGIFNSSTIFLFSSLIFY